jgi:hypothetical protein
MTQLVIIVVAAVWAAVIIPPLLRSRVENRPNSSVTDFRRQLSTLQSTSSRGGMRTIGRPLAPSPLQRPAAAGRPGQHRQASIHGTTATQPRPAQRHAEPSQFRSHGDPSGGYERHHRQMHLDRAGAPRRATRRVDPRADVRRRRANVLFLLVVSTACTMFLAATTSSTVLLYAFALSFLALCGYVYLLAQVRQREASGWNDNWLNGH